MRREILSTRGALLLETTFVLPVFALIIVLVYSFLVTFMAQNLMLHALVQTVDSLALDSYARSKYTSSGEIEASAANNGIDGSEFYSGIGDIIADAYRSGNSEYFSESGVLSPETVKKRFLGYLSGGNQEEANTLMDALGIVDGYDGIDFTLVKSEKDVSVTIDYHIQFLIDVAGIGDIPQTQKISARLWASEAEELNINVDNSGDNNADGG